MREWDKNGKTKVWDGVKHWMQTETSDPKDWCSLNWQNPLNKEPTGCKLRSQELNKIEQPWLKEDTEEFRNAFNEARQTLSLEWERPLLIGQNETAFDLVAEQLYDIKMFYGIFKHDGQEDASVLLGGQNLTLKLNQSELRQSSATFI